MRKTRILAAIALSAFVGTMAACDDSGDLTNIDVDEEFAANLNSLQVIPSPIGTTGATGVAAMSLIGDVLTVGLSVDGLLSSAVTGAAIHGPTIGNQIAPIVLDLTPAMVDAITFGALGGRLAVASFDLAVLPVDPNGVLRVDPATLVNMLRSGAAYVQVRTVLNPLGEIRGGVIPQQFQNDNNCCD